MPATEDTSGIFRQVVVFAAPGLGVGAQADARDYQDRGTDTLAHVATYMGGLELRILQWLGLGNVAPARGVGPADPPAASFGRAARATEGRDPEGALDELIGPACRALGGAGIPVCAVGAAADMLEAYASVERRPADSLTKLVDTVTDVMNQRREGLIVAVPRRGVVAGAGPVGIARGLASLDAAIVRLLDQQPEDTVLIITSLGGHDATIAPGTGPTREDAPILAYTPAVPSGIALGKRSTLADIGATVVEILGVDEPAPGTSFYAELLS